jgi:cytochrome c biogenesis protein CcdA
MYQPLRVFFYIGFSLIILGLIPSVRFLYIYLTTGGKGHIQSLILAAILFILGFQVLMIGLVADIISFNRKLIEEALMRVRRLELKNGDHRSENK